MSNQKMMSTRKKWPAEKMAPSKWPVGNGPKSKMAAAKTEIARSFRNELIASKRTVWYDLGYQDTYYRYVRCQ